MILQAGTGLDCGTLGRGVMVKRTGTFSMIPVLDDAKRVVGALFGPAWALPKDGVRAFAEKVWNAQRGRGDVGNDKRAAACYFGWLCPYASVAYVTRGMGSVASHATGQWSFLTGMCPGEGNDAADVQKLVMAYGAELSSRVLKREGLKAATDSMVKAGRGYLFGFIACTPTPLSG
jgi:hypothetical protein